MNTPVAIIPKGNGEKLELTESQPIPIKLTKQAIAVIVENVQLAEQLVTSALEKDVDYGRTPGVPQDGLWDPGASKIMAAFNCYPDHEIIFHEESDDLITWTIQAKLINRQSQQIMTSGLGCCSTREKKYKYRWVPDPEHYGYTEAEINELQHDDEKNKYRIENPEYGELVNTLLQMSAKRAEVDATKTLPGVGSALRKLFDPKLRGNLSNGNELKRFWAMVKGMGINEKSAHKALGVDSVKDWLESGKTYDEAIIAIGRYMSNYIKNSRHEEPDASTEEAEQSGF